MPDTRNVHSPYPRGQGLTSVPVLFSLPNVQPVIAAASMTAAGESTAEIENTASPSTLTSTAAPSPTGGPTSVRTPIAPALPAVDLGNSAAGKASSGSGKLFSAGFMSQVTNVTIGVLLIAVCVLGARNYMGTQTTSKEFSSTGTELAIDPVVDMPPALQVRTASLPSVPVSSNESVSSRTQVHDASHRLPPEPNASQPIVSNEPVPSAAPSASSPAIPLLLPKTPPQEAAPKETNSIDAEPRSSGNGPYGTSSAATPPASNIPNSVPANLASTSTAPPVAAPSMSREVAPAVPAAIDTDTPTLNTRDIILMRSGQRRPLPNASTDPSLPKMESVPKVESLSRSSDGKGTTTLMSGQTYPPVAPQYEPISMNPGALGQSSSAPIAAPQDNSSTTRNRYQPVGSPMVQPNQRITQPSTTALPPSSNALPPASSPAKPYTPLSPVLPNPDGIGNLESPSTPNNLP